MADTEKKKKTRGAFALIMKDGKILLSKRADGKGWNLPGGGVHDGESDEDAVVREAREETGLDVTVRFQVGSGHVFNDDTAVAFLCDVVGGTLTPTAEAVEHGYFRREQVRDMKIVGPEGRLGRTGRMIYDGLSLLLDPVITELEGMNILRSKNGVFISEDGTCLCFESVSHRRTWRRLDPYSPTGFLEIA